MLQFFFTRMDIVTFKTQLLQHLVPLQVIKIITLGKLHAYGKNEWHGTVNVVLLQTHESERWREKYREPCGSVQADYSFS